jgi:hypothetical protein
LEEGIKKVNDKISDRMKHINIPLSAAAYIPLSAGGGWRLPGVVISFTNYSYCFVFVIFFLELSLIIRFVLANN